MSTSIPKVLFICGSLRFASTNKGLLQAAAKLITPGSVEIVYPNIELPFYNGDLECSTDPNCVEVKTPYIVQLLRDQFDSADAILIATPEYNGSYPAILKNALDWMTRSKDGKSRTLKNLPIGVISSAGGGGMEVQEAIKKFTLRLKGHFIEFPQAVGIQSAYKFDPKTGDLVDTSVLPALQKAVDAVVAAAGNLWFP